MSVTQHELDAFHRCATDRLRKSEEELTIEDLVIEWDSMRNREQINLPMVALAYVRNQLKCDTAHDSVEGQHDWPIRPIPNEVR